MELDLFSLEQNEEYSSELWGVYGFSMALGSPHFNVQGCVPVLLEKCLLFSMVCLASELGSLVDLGFSIGMDYWVGACLLMLPEVRSSLML